MAQELITTRSLISDSWRTYVRDWNRMMEVSLWMLVFPALTLVLAFLLSGISADVTSIVLSIISVVDGLFSLWILIRLIRLAMAENPKDEGLIVHNLRNGWDMFLPFLLVTILNSLAVLGGFVLLVLPGVWLGTLFIFAQFIVIEENRRGLDALAASAKLVSGRWWQTFVRIVVPGLVFLSLAVVALWAVNTLIGVFIGFETVNRVMQAAPGLNGLPLTANALKSQAIIVFIGRIPQALFMPIFIVFLHKLYKSLKETV